MAKDDNYYPPKTLENTVRAPYNFVPFTERQPFMRYTDVSELPAHDKLCAELLTGEIHLTLTAETPVFVSDGQENADFFRGANGNYMIPGSTIRGMVRENMQILGDGLVLKDEDLEDLMLTYREVAGIGVKEKLRKHYHEEVINKCKPGYLVKENGEYIIVHVPERKVKKLKYKDAQKQYGDGNDLIGCVKKVPFGTDQGMGMLLCPGKSVQDKKDVYLFPPFDSQQDIELLSQEDILFYLKDCEDRKNVAKEYQNFWKLPEGGEPKPVFYVRYGEHIFFGMTKTPRVRYKKSLAAGLPSYQRTHYRKMQQNNELPLDYPHAILGFTHNFKDENKKSSNTSYRSRVSFGDFEMQSEPEKRVTYKTVLGEPKPSYFPSYTVNGQHYSEDFRLRGFKQYWLKKANAPEPPNDNENVPAIMRPMPEKSVFSGTIRFKNLKEDELGLLLWSLVLNDGCYQSIGMGKPYGFGRMSVKLDKLRLFDFAALYSASGFESAGRTAECKPFIQAYKQFMNDNKSKTAPEMDDRPEIKDFFYLKKTIREDTEMVDYLTIDQKKEPKRLLFKEMYYPLPSVAELREEAEKDAPKYDSAEDATAALLLKFGAKTHSSNTGKSSKKKKK